MSDVTIACTIGGVAVTLISQVQVQERVNQRSTCTFGVIDSANTLVIGQNMKVVLTENGVNKFVGYVDTAEKQVIVSNSSLIALFNVTCKDGHYLADKMVYTGPELTGVTSGDAVALIHQSTLASQGITANYAIDYDHDLTTWSAGTQSTTQATTDGLQLLPAGTNFVKTETTNTDWNAGTSSNIYVANNDMTIGFEPAIKLSGDANALAGANLMAYYDIYDFSGRVVSNGDRLQYWIWITGDSQTQQSGIDLIFTDGTTMRDASQASLDQFQLPSHPNTNLGPAAVDQWYWRDISISSVNNGKTIDYCAMALEGDQAGTYTTYIKRIYYTNSSHTVLETIFDGTTTNFSPWLLGSEGYDNLIIQSVEAYQGSCQRVSPTYVNSSCNVLRSSLMSWTSTETTQPTVSGNTYPPQVLVEVSYDNGFTWIACTNKQPIPNMIAGMSVSGKSFKFRQTLSIGGPNLEVAPVLHDCTLTLIPASTATKNDVVNSSLAGDASMATGTLTRLTNDATKGLSISGWYRNWTVSTDTSGQSIYSSVTAAPATQSIFVHDLQMRCTGAGDGKISFDWINQHSDFTADIDIVPHNSTGIYGVFYRTTSLLNTNDTYCYFCGIDMTNQLLVLGHGSNSTSSVWTQITTTLGKYTVDQTYHMQLVIIGTSHKIYIDGVLVINVTDTFYTGNGYFGVRYYNSTTSRLSAFWRNFGLIDGSNLSGTRTWPSVSVSAAGVIDNSVIQWNASVPSATNLVVQASLDGGATYQACTNNAPIPGCGAGVNLVGKSLLLQAILSTKNCAQTPGLFGLTFLISSAFSSSGVRTSPSMNISGVGYLGSSSFSWVADTPVGTSVTGKTSLDGITYTGVTSGGAVAGLTSQPVQVSDGFTTNTSTDYTKTFESGGSVPTMTYDTVNSKMTISGGLKGHAIWNKANFNYDGTLYAIVYASDAAGFTLRTTDVSNHYKIILTDSTAVTNQSKVTIYRMLTGTLTQIGQVSIDFNHNTYHTVTFAVLSNVVTISWDGVQVFTYTDATSPGGVGGGGLYSTTGGSMVVQKLVVQTIGSKATSTATSSQLLLTSTDPLHSPVIHTAVMTIRGPKVMTGNTLLATKYQYQNAASDIDDAAKQSNMIWKVQTDSSLIFLNRAAQLAAWPLWSGVKLDGTSDLMAANVPKLTTQAPLYRNRHYVYNAYQLITVTEYKPGDGYTSSWPLQYPVDSVTSFVVTPVGSSVSQGKTVSLTATSGYDFYIKTSTLSQDASAQLLTSDQLITITYVGRAPYVAMKENTASQATLAGYDGVAGGFSVVAMSEDGGGINNTAADALAQARIDQYCVLPSRDWEFTTMRTGLAIGTLLTIFATEYGLNDIDMLINEMSTTYMMHGALSSPIYDVKCTEGPPIGTWADIFLH